MSISLIVARVSALGAVTAVLGGCAIPLRTGGGGGGPAPSAEAVAACNTRADEVFLRQNRDAIYKADRYTSSLRDAPFAGSGLPGSTAGLSAQYERNQDVRTCLNGVTTPNEPVPRATAAP